MKIPKIMSQNSENDFNVSKVKAKQIFSKEHMIQYLKIFNQGSDRHDFPEQIIKKEFKEISMN